MEIVGIGQEILNKLGLSQKSEAVTSHINSVDMIVAFILLGGDLSKARWVMSEDQFNGLLSEKVAGRYIVNNRTEDTFMGLSVIFDDMVSAGNYILSDKRIIINYNGKFSAKVYYQYTFGEIPMIDWGKYNFRNVQIVFDGVVGDNND